MLSKVFTGHSFYGSIRYICHDESRMEILATAGVRAHDYRLMIQDFMLQQELHPSKKQACFHSILSFYPRENPGNEKMVEIAKKYLEDIGITDTQYAITKHTDKKHLHLHIVANLVDNNGNVIKDNWIGYRGKKVAQRLTQEYNLIPALKKDLALTNLEALSGSEANKYKIYSAITEHLPKCRTMEELEARLLKQGIETQYKYKGGTNEKQGVSFRIENDSFKGSKVDRKFSLSNLEKTIELQQKQVPEQYPKQVQNPEILERIAKQEPTVSMQTVTSNNSTTGIKELTQVMGKMTGNVIDAFMNPELQSEQMSNEFSQELKHRRKKKHRHRISR